jgi:hypothetical protein
MIKFIGVKLSPDEMKYIRAAAKFTLDKYITRYRQNKIDIEVNLVEDKKMTWGGDCTYFGIEEDRKKFEVRIQSTLVKKQAKKIDTRMKDLVATLIHELIHVKQYVNNQLFDYVDGKTVRYEGKIYKDSDDFVSYWDLPYEIEAYGRTVGTYELFIRCLKQKQLEAMKAKL